MNTDINNTRSFIVEEADCNGSSIISQAEETLEDIIETEGFSKKYEILMFKGGIN